MTYRNIAKWKRRALAHAKTLKGRERTQREKDFAAKHPDPWDYFYVFGPQEDTQAYINKTIDLIQKCDNIADQVICQLRLEWTHQALKERNP